MRCCVVLCRFTVVLCCARTFCVVFVVLCCFVLLCAVSCFVALLCVILVSYCVVQWRFVFVVLCCVVLCCVVMCCVVLCCVVLCCVVLCCVVLLSYCVVRGLFVLCCVVLYCVVLSFIVSCCVVLCFVVLLSYWRLGLFLSSALLCKKNEQLDQKNSSNARVEWQCLLGAVVPHPTSDQWWPKPETLHQHWHYSISLIIIWEVMLFGEVASSMRWHDMTARRPHGGCYVLFLSNSE